MIFGGGPPKTQPLYGGVAGTHSISDNINSGYMIKLEDGSVWEISPTDQADTSIWLATEEITVVEGDDPSYPYKLINTHTEEVAEAKLLSQ